MTGSLRAAAELVGCDLKTVGHWARARDEAGGGLPVHVRSRPRVDAFAEKIEEWAERSRGKVRADVCHQKLVAEGLVQSDAVEPDDPLDDCQPELASEVARRRRPKRDGRHPATPRNHRTPTGPDTPASAAASKLDAPSAIASQNQRQ